MNKKLLGTFIILLSMALLVAIYLQFRHSLIAITMVTLIKALGFAGYIIAGLFLIFPALAGMVGFATSISYLIISGLGIDSWIAGLSLFYFEYALGLFLFVGLSVGSGLLYRYLERLSANAVYWAIIIVILASALFSAISNFDSWVGWFVNGTSPNVLRSQFPPLGPFIAAFQVFTIIFSIIKKFFFGEEETVRGSSSV